MAHMCMEMSLTRILVIKYTIRRHTWGVAYVVFSKSNPSQVMIVWDSGLAKGEQE